MLVYLDHNACWKSATRFYHADTLSYWRKRKNLPQKKAETDDASIQELAGQIRTYFESGIDSHLFCKNKKDKIINSLIYIIGGRSGIHKYH